MGLIVRVTSLTLSDGLLAAAAAASGGKYEIDFSCRYPSTALMERNP